MAEREVSDFLKQEIMRLRADLNVHRVLINELGTAQAASAKSSFKNNKSLSEWIGFFEQTLARLDKSMEVLNARQGAIELELSKSSSNFDSHLSGLRMELSELIARVSKKDEVFAVQTELKTQQKVREPAQDKSGKSSGILQISALSNPEKWLIGVLFNSETPLSYQQIAERTKKSVSSIRVYMNQLKLRGFVDESLLPNGNKIFELKHEAKVKTLYNI